MTTQDIVSAFIDGQESGNASGGRLQIIGNRLMNYNTCIAQRSQGGLIVNVTKYSPTTSKHQTRLKRAAPVTGTIYVQGVPMGANDLSMFAN